MAAKKSHAQLTWEENDATYPRKKDICHTCKQRDDVKLSFDRIHYICINGSACMLRFAKLHTK